MVADLTYIYFENLFLKVILSISLMREIKKVGKNSVTHVNSKYIASLLNDIKKFNAELLIRLTEHCVNNKIWKKLFGT